VKLTKDVVRAFLPEVESFKSSPLGSGLIHQTLLVESEAGSHVFQRLNNNVFPNLDHVMENIQKVTALLKEQGESTLDFLVAEPGGKLLFKDDAGSFWRCSVHLDDTVTYDLPPTPAHLKNAARAFASFGQRLSGEAISLHATIEGFHDTPKRFQAMEEAWKQAPIERQSAADYFALRHLATGFEAYGLDGLLEPHVPQAVSHNDTKLNNCLFRKNSEEVLCVIDLDTVMPGNWLLDFGDLCRTSICALAEDTEDLDDVEVDLERFCALAQGYAEVLAETVTTTERERMVYSVFLLTYELALRFFTDYLQEDRYFGAKYPEHNLTRARSQLTLALKVLDKREAMEKIVLEAFTRP
jgi:N-acetylhexosamine 1-kinase